MLTFGTSIGYTLVSKSVQDLPKVDNNMKHMGCQPEGIMLFTEGKSCTVLESKVHYNLFLAKTGILMLSYSNYAS